MNFCLKKFLYLLNIMIILFSASLFFVAKGQEDTLFNGCPKSGHAGLASVCGTVKSALIEIDGGEITEKPLEGITVALYEANPDSDTGLINGKLTNLFSSTATNKNGQYHLTMRKIGPLNNNVYVVFFCNGELGWYKRLANSLKDHINIDASVSCSSRGEYVYTLPPSKLDFVDRSGSIACVTRVDSTSPEPLDIGFKEVKPIVKVSSEAKEESYDSRYYDPDGDFSILGFTIGSYVGAYRREDCVWKKGKGPGDGKAAMECDYDDVRKKTYPQDFYTDPHLASLPEENNMEGYRQWEVRSDIQGKNASATAVSQASHGLLGSFDDRYSYRKNSDPSDFEYIDCEQLKLCNDPISMGDDISPNQQKCGGLAINLATPYTWVEIQKAVEENPDKPVCKHTNGEVMTVKDIMPPWAASAHGYKMPREYFNPTYILMSGAAVETWSQEVVGDSFAATAPRSEPFDVFKTATDDPTKTNLHIVYNEEGNASPTKLLRVVSPDDFGVKGGNIADVLKTPYTEDTYKPDLVVYDGARDMVRLCPAAGVTGLDEVKNTDASKEDEDKIILASNFRGTAEDQYGSLSAGTGSYFFGDKGLDRTGYLSQRVGLFGIISMLIRDLHDVCLRVASGGGALEYGKCALGWFASAIGDGGAKSFGKRTGYGSGSGELPTPDIVPKMVHYPLSEANFDENFPAYGQGGYPGEHADYPWNDVLDVLAGGYCDVAPGPGNGPVTQIRTCKIVSCKYVWKTSEISACLSSSRKKSCVLIKHPDGSGSCMSPGKGITCTPKYEVVDHERSCELSESEACLISQHDTSGAVAEDPPEGGKSPEVRVCDLWAAGPYKYQADLEEVVNASMEQEDTLGEVSVELVTKKADIIALSFRTPGEPAISSPKDASVDWTHTNRVGSEGDKTWGAPVPTIGSGFTDTLVQVVQTPTSFGGGGFDNLENLYYHCRLADSMDNKIIPPRGQIKEEGWNCPVYEVPDLVDTCKGDLFSNVQEHGSMPRSTASEAETWFGRYIAPLFAESNPYAKDLITAYATAEAATGVPCEILAGIHSTEGSCGWGKSLLNGDPIPEGTMVANAISAAVHLKSKQGGKPDVGTWKFEDYVTALSRYNGGGNANCPYGTASGTFPATPWISAKSISCPPPYAGWDDNYPMSMIDDKHVGMYFRYCYDRGLCPGGFQEYNRAGALAVAILFHSLGK